MAVARRSVVRRRAIVHGSVQGVGFRANTQARAQRLNLIGSVRNLPDGTVEIEAEGPEGDVAQLLDWLRSGPRWARVDKVEVHELDPVQRSHGDREFRIV